MNGQVLSRAVLATFRFTYCVGSGLNIEARVGLLSIGGWAGGGGSSDLNVCLAGSTCLP